MATNKKEKFKNRLQQATSPADLIFPTGETEEVKPEEKPIRKPKVPKVKAVPVSEIKHRKDKRVKDEYDRINLFVPPELKENVSKLASFMQSNLTKVIIEQMERYVNEHSETLKALNNLKKSNEGA